jgi:hypothetical protein
MKDIERRIENLEQHARTAKPGAKSCLIMQFEDAIGYLLMESVRVVAAGDRREPWFPLDHERYRLSWRDYSKYLRLGGHDLFGDTPWPLPGQVPVVPELDPDKEGHDREKAIESIIKALRPDISVLDKLRVELKISAFGIRRDELMVPDECLKGALPDWFWSE